MPERPDLEYALPILAKTLKGAEISGAQLHKPPVLRLAVEGTLEAALAGSKISGLRRRLHFVCFDLQSPSDVALIIAPMLAGSLSVHQPKEGNRRDRALTFLLADGRELRYRDSVQMGKVYVIPAGRHDLIPGYENGGMDVLSKKFTFEAFQSIAKKRRDQVKVFLLDKSAVDSFGNAYADEVLFAAGIHPKTFVRKLADDDLRRLHRAMSSVLRAANREIKRRRPATDEKIRDFLKVRGRHKQPCPTCETPIRKAGVRGFDAFFCPSCQPETRKSGVVNWR